MTRGVFTAMKFRTIKYFIKEGFADVWANKRMSIASACVIMLTLFMFGGIFLIAVNFGSMSEKLSDQPILAYVTKTTDSKAVSTIRDSIKKIPGVKSVNIVSREQGFKELQDTIPGYEKLLHGINPSFLPFKMVVNVSDPLAAQTVKGAISKISGVENVVYAQTTMDKLLRIIKIIKLILYFVIVILGIMALFIIIYTIKLTVFSRRREINIMKYVGATDWFIKWPFVIEGIFIGILGAFVSAILMLICYDYIYGIVGATSVSIIEMVPINSAMRNEIFLIFILLGSSIGAIGSVISVRKYLDV